MDSAVFTERLWQWLDERGALGEGSAEGLEGQLRGVLAFCRAAVRGVGEVSPGVRVIDHTKYDFIESRLPDLLAFDDFSLAECSFQLPEQRRPGFRLWLDGPRDGRRLSVIAFEDVVRWRASFDGEKLQTTRLVVELGGPAIVVVEPFGAVGSWRELLVGAIVATLEVGS